MPARNQEEINKKEAKNKLTLYHKFSRQLEIDASTVIFFSFWFILQALVFIFCFINYAYNANFATSRASLGATFLIARGTSLPIEVNTGIVMLPMCRSIITHIRKTSLSKIIPFDANKKFHKLIGWTIVIFSVCHSLAHYANFTKLHLAGKFNFFALMFLTGTGITGNIMFLALIILACTSINSVRMKNFELFWYIHHLFGLFFFMYSFHGGFCLVPKDFAPYCAGANFYKYWTVSGLLYLYERVMREFRGHKKTYICKVVKHPSQVFEIQFRREDFEMRAGQYCFICIPEISLHQWHPFTISSAPEDNYISVHIRVAGDFTKNLSKRLGCDFSNDNVDEFKENLPSIMVDGPFGAASEDFFNYEVSILVGAGIGVTPFSSILRSIWYRIYTPTVKGTRLNKVYFIWISRDKAAFEWLEAIIKLIEQEDIHNFISISTYLTGKLNKDEINNLALNYDFGKKDVLTGFKSETNYGRPNWDQIFTDIKKVHPSTDVGVFFCGPKALNKVLKKATEDHSELGKSGTKFFYNKENF